MEHKTKSRHALLRACLLAVTLMLVALPLVGAAPLSAINPSASALDIANAIAVDPAWITDATFVAQPPTPNTANAVSDTPLTSFPINGPTYGILTSGSAANVATPGIFTSVGLGGGPVRGNTDRDVTILKIDLTVPDQYNCLSIDFQFLSEEYPIYVNSQFNDAFIAELDSSTWTTAGSVINAPNNFAFDPDGNVVSINSTGVTQMSPSNGIGTAYDGGMTSGGDSNGAATVLLRASTPAAPGQHSLYLSIFDQGDTVLDSAVFLDNLALGYTDEGQCIPGAQPVPEISLVKTVGIEPGVCADTTTIDVPAGTEVVYCYEVANTGTVALTTHNLVDDQLGAILTDYAQTLAPGESTYVLATDTIMETTVNVATWTASAGAYSAQAEASATVTVACQWYDETAWAAGTRYVNRGNWATYTTYAPDSTVTLYAGQTMEAGTVNFSAVDGDGNVTITITLNDGWRFEDVYENVKVQGYASAPSGNPAPGLFAHKGYAEGSSFSIEVPANTYFGVHVNVERVQCD